MNKLNKEKGRKCVFLFLSVLFVDFLTSLSCKNYWVQPFLSCYFLFLGGQHLRHMEVPRLGVKLELQLQAYTTATAITDPSHICDLCHSMWQCQIHNPLRKARDGTCTLTDTMLATEPQQELLRTTFFLLLFVLLGPHPQLMEVHRLGI